MTSADWACPICKRAMIKTSPLYMVCPLGHGKLHCATSEADLPLATRIDYKRFTIEGHSGWWQYQPKAHGRALHYCPAEGIVVAAVQLRKSQRIVVRAFRRTTPPRATS